MRIPCAAGAALLSLAATTALAGPGAYVHTPIVEYGEREIDFHGGVAKAGDGTSERAYALGFGMGVKPWWFTEVYGVFEGETGRSTRYEAFEWENIFQLTETGRHAFDAGLLFELERPREHAEGWEVKFGPLLQTELGRVQLNGNVLIERHLDAAEHHDTGMLYEWQAKYRWRPAFEFGAQGFGEMGEWDHWANSDEQSHVLGPALFGKVALGGRTALRYDAAYLVAASPAAPDHTLRFRVEYEF